MSAGTKASCVKALMYKEYGEPIDVLQITSQTIDEPTKDQVIITDKLIQI